MHTAIALLSVATAGLLVWLVIRIVDTGSADLSIVSPVMRADDPSSFWTLTIGLVVLALLLLLLAAVMLVSGPVIKLVQ